MCIRDRRYIHCKKNDVFHNTPGGLQPSMILSLLLPHIHKWQRHGYPSLNCRCKFVSKYTWSMASWCKKPKVSSLQGNQIRSEYNMLVFDLFYNMFCNFLIISPKYSFICTNYSLIWHCAIIFKKCMHNNIYTQYTTTLQWFDMNKINKLFNFHNRYVVVDGSQVPIATFYAFLSESPLHMFWITPLFCSMSLLLC